MHSEVRRISQRAAEEARFKYNHINHQSRIAWLNCIEACWSMISCQVRRAGGGSGWRGTAPGRDRDAEPHPQTHRRGPLHAYRQGLQVVFCAPAKVLQARFMHVVAQIPSWDLCAPDMQAAIAVMMSHPIAQS